MNKANNKRRKKSVEKIETVFSEMIQTNDISEISVSEICKRADINRSTFYSNFEDIYDLAEKFKYHMEEDIKELYAAEIASKGSTHGFEKLFGYIRDHRLLFQTYLKLDYNNTMFIGYDKQLAMEVYCGKNIEYHIEFFKSGLNAMLKLWIKNGCKESPEELHDILKEEYRRLI